MKNRVFGIFLVLCCSGFFPAGPAGAGDVTTQLAFRNYTDLFFKISQIKIEGHMVNHSWPLTVGRWRWSPIVTVDPGKKGSITTITITGSFIPAENPLPNTNTRTQNKFTARLLLMDRSVWACKSFKLKMVHTFYPEHQLHFWELQVHPAD